MSDAPTDEAEDPASRLISEADADTVEVDNLLSNLRTRLFGESESGRTIGRYELRKRLGVGGVGVVYSAWDPELSREVAVKLLRPERGAGPRWSQRMAREAQAMARIDHPNVVQVFDVGTHEREGGGTTVFIVMPLLEGTSLGEWFRERPTWRQVVRACIDAGRGLAAAHKQGLVHRDFKPNNAMIDASGHVRVLDFGLVGTGAGESDSNKDDPRPFSEGLTATGSMLGTPPYMALEQHDAGAVGPAADQFALCATLFEGLHSKRAFPQTALFGLVEAKRERSLPSSDIIVPPRLTQIIHRGLAPESSARFGSMAELCDALEAVLRGRSSWWWVAAAGTGLGVFGLLLAGDANPCAGREPPSPVASEDAAERLRVHFRDVSGPLGAEVAERVVEVVRERDAAIADGWAAACRPSAAISTERRKRTHACLTEAHAASASLIDRLNEADGRGIASAVGSALRLPDPTGCSGTDTDDSVDPELAQLRRDAHRLDVLIEQADFDAGLALAGLLVGRAQALDAPQIEIRARKNLAHMIVYSDSDEATVQLVRASLLAQSMGAYDLAVVTWVNLAQLYLNSIGNSEAGAEALQRAEEAAARVQGDLATQRVLMIGRGELARAQGRPNDAVAAYERALELASEVHGEESPEATDAYQQLAVSYRHAGQLERAHESASRAVELDSARYGPLHGDLVALYGNLGTIQFELKDYEAALKSFERALTIERASGRGLTGRAARVHGRIAAIMAELGRMDEAAAAYDKTLAELESLGQHDRPAGAEILLNYGVLEKRRDDLERAIALTKQAVDVLRESGDITSQLVRGLLHLTDYHGEAGDQALAAEYADEAWKAMATQGDDSPLRAYACLVVAKAWSRVGRVEDVTVRAEDVVRLHAVGRASDDQLAHAKALIAKPEPDADILPP